jgi:hypothetical protein
MGGSLLFFGWILHQESTLSTVLRPDYLKELVLFDVVLMESNHRLGFLCAFVNDLLYLSIDQGLHSLSIGLSVLNVRKGNVTQLAVHTQLTYYSICQVVCFLKIIVGACCDLVEKVELGTSPTQNETYSIQQLLLCLKLVLVEKVLCESKGSFRARNDGDFK